MRLLLISGSTRRNSTNAAALDVVRRTAPPGSHAVIYQGLPGLPAFNPDDDIDPLPVPVRQLRAEIGAADAVVVSIPEYAGTLPGSVKNLLDWTVGGTELTGKPVAWINVAAAGRGQGSVTTLESVLGYVGASVVADACLSIPVSRDALDTDGTLTDATVIAVLSEIWRTLATAVCHCDGGSRDV
jgi:NAD(P)H-dependent FMN reductase